MVFHEDWHEELLEFVSAEGLKVEEVDYQVEDFLKIFETVGSHKGMLLEEELDLRRRSPLVVHLLGEQRNVEPDNFDDHLGIVDKFAEHFVLYFTLEVVPQNLDEVEHGLTEANKFLAAHKFLPIAEQNLRYFLYLLNFFVVEIVLFHQLLQIGFVDEVKLLDFTFAGRD
jgi:hypothetical protein